MRFGEDIDMSIRILKNNYKTQLIKDAFVYHKRRTGIKQFFKQVYNSGIARINLYIKYPESLKFVHALPSFFVLGIILILISSVIFPVLLFLILLHIFSVFIDSSIKNKSIVIGFLSILTSYIQFFGYGFGFIIAFFKRVVFKKKEFDAFNKTFYN